MHNIFTDVLFLFIYIFTLFFLRLPDVTNSNYFMHKIFIFISVFAFSYVLELIKLIKNECKIDTNIILQKSLNTAIYCALGYSIYVDMLYMNSTSSYFGNIAEVNLTNRFLVISLIIIVFVTSVRLVELLFETNHQICQPLTK